MVALVGHCRCFLAGLHSDKGKVIVRTAWGIIPSWCWCRWVMSLWGGTYPRAVVLLVEMNCQIHLLLYYRFSHLSSLNIQNRQCLCGVIEVCSVATEICSIQWRARFSA